MNTAKHMMALYIQVLVYYVTECGLVLCCNYSLPISMLSRTHYDLKMIIYLYIFYFYFYFFYNYWLMLLSLIKSFDFDLIAQAFKEDTTLEMDSF